MGNRISELRKAKGMTQEELVELCNISVRTIQRIETGKVNPRSYTVKTILSALGSDLEELQVGDTFSDRASKTLRISWMAGTAYFILGFPEGSMDFTRTVGDSPIPGSVVNDLVPVMEYGANSYMSVKILVLVGYIFFMRGFVAIGDNTNYPLLAAISRILIGVMALVIGFDIVSFYFPGWDGPFVQIGIALAVGVLEIIFGIAVINLRPKPGLICVFAGSVEIVAGVLFLFLNPAGLIVQMLAVLLETIGIYQFSKLTVADLNTKV